MQFKFNVKKATQAACVLLRLNDGDMDKYIFIKMLYLADRISLEKWNEPLTGDSPVSMQYGPVLSTVYDLTKGACPRFQGDWGKFVSPADQQTNRISLLKEPGTDELSKSEEDILKQIHRKFRNYNWKMMRDYCHKLKEYEERKSGSKPISYESILEAVGKQKEEICEAAEQTENFNRVELLFGAS